MLSFAAATRLHRQLTELPGLLAHAQLSLQPGSRPRGGHVTGATRTAPLPCRLDVLSLLGPAATGTVRDPYGDQDGLTPVAGAVDTWARLIAEESGVQPARWTLGEELAYLAQRDVLAWSVQQLWADEYAAEIGDVHRRLTPLAMLQPRRRLMSLPCPRCQLLSLVQEDGRDIECTNPTCKVILRQEEYDRRADAYAEALEAA